MKKSFKLFYDSLDVLDELTDEQAGQLFKAIRSYEIDEIELLEGIMKAVFTPFKNNIDRGKEAYEKVVERNKANGLKGGRPITQDNPVGLNETQNNPQKADKDKDKKVSISRFKKPTKLEIEEYGKEIEYLIDGNKFIDFYESKGWLIGKNKMKCWKSALRTWKNKHDSNMQTEGKHDLSVFDRQVGIK